MRVIRIKRTISNRNETKRLTGRRPIRDLGRAFFSTENAWEFVIEALLFGVLLATSAWPIVAAAGAITQLL